MYGLVSGLKPFLDGRTNIERCTILEERKQGIVAKLLEALSSRHGLRRRSR